MDDRLLVVGATASLCVDVVGDELLLTAVDSFGEMQVPIQAKDEDRLREWLNKRVPVAKVIGLPMLVKNSRGWEVLGEDGARFGLVLVSAAPNKRAEQGER